MIGLLLMGVAPVITYDDFKDETTVQIAPYVIAERDSSEQFLPGDNFEVLLGFKETITGQETNVVDDKDNVHLWVGAWGQYRPQTYIGYKNLYIIADKQRFELTQNYSIPHWRFEEKHHTFPSGFKVKYPVILIAYTITLEDLKLISEADEVRIKWAELPFIINDEAKRNVNTFVENVTK